MLQLIITADDLGIDPRRDEGIFNAFTKGAITQASLMVAGRSAESAAREARRLGLPVGLHLDLTETPPSAAPNSVQSLLDAEGNKLGKHGLRAALAAGRVTAEHVRAETEAQLERFRALLGAEARHVDGHQHVHTIPALATILAPIFQAHRVATTRVPEQREVNVPDPEAARFYRSVSDDGARARGVFRACGVRSTEVFVGLDLMGMASDPAKLLAAVRALHGISSAELMCHPGYVGSGGDDFNRSPAREHELSVLCSLPFAPALDAGEVRLASFATLAGEPPC